VKLPLVQVPAVTVVAGAVASSLVGVWLLLEGEGVESQGTDDQRVASQ